MKILVISHEYPPVGGGGANACLFLTRGYAKAGHKVTVITVWYEGLQVRELLDGVEICRLKSKRTSKEHCSFSEMFDYIRKAYPVADRMTKKKSYDVCQVFFGIPSGPVGYWLKKRYGLPYIIRFGGGDIPGFQERFKRIYQILGPFVKLLWNDADALVANSEGLQVFARKFYDKKPIAVICNGVDTAAFYPRECDTNSGQIHLLFVSRLIERKGLQFVIPKLMQIQSASGQSVRLTVVGDGPYRQALENLAKQCGVNEMITFVGQKEKDDLLPYYQSGDIFLFPSKREGMPNAVLEAMACGLPILMAPCEGSKELIDGNGMIVEAEKMGDLLSEIVTDRDRLRSWGRESRRRAVELFSWDRVVQSYLEMMRGVV